MIDPVELEITRGLAGMRSAMGLPQPDNVIPFPGKIINWPLSHGSNLYGRLADNLLAIEALADLMGVMAKEIEQKNIERQVLIDMLKKGERAARDALERLGG